MGIRCLLGHDFGGREVERDRREAGDEVVVAYRTVETCERCGSRRVVSENKEIKPLKSASEAAEASSQESPSPTESASQDAVTATTDEAKPPNPDSSETVAASTGGGGVADATEDAAIILDDAPPTEGESTGPEASVGTGPSAETPDTSGPAPDLDAAVESEPDTELLDDDADEAGDEDLAVVDDGETAALDSADAWPDDDDADGGFDAESPTPGGPTVAAADGDGAPAPWPDEAGVERDSNGTKFVRPDAETPDRGAVTEFHCPNCGATQAASASSLRSGDVCPDCQKGYLAERQVEG
jgi:transcription elongation factor Elf1